MGIYAYAICATCTRAKPQSVWEVSASGSQVISSAPPQPGFSSFTGLFIMRYVKVLHQCTSWSSMKVPLSWSNLLILNFEILILFWFHLIGFSTSMVDRIYFNLLQFTQFTSIINQFTHFDVSRFWIVHDWTFWCRILPGLQSQQLQSCAQAPKSLGSRSSCANSKSSGSGTKRKTQPRFTDQNHQVVK